MKRNFKDIAEFILGMWLCSSPFILGFFDVREAGITALVIGLAVVLIGEFGIFLPRLFEDTSALVLGICLLGSPWILGYQTLEVATTNAMIGGVLLIVLSLVQYSMDYKEIRQEKAPPTAA
jgi:hypothetical protein